jgi:hypothetical protein
MRILKLMFLLFFTSSLLSQTTGKITGVITDAITGDALPGVDVIIENSRLGASTDAEGFYVVLNVPAGDYNVRFSYVGYKKHKVQNIRVVSGITKTLNIELVESVLEDDEVIVIATRPLFERGATNQVRVIDSKEIEKLPIRGVAEMAKISAGVVSSEGDNNLYVRGSRSDGVKYYVDGMPMTITLPQAAISQTSVEIGAFNAKYGDINGGIVHVSTKSASRDFRVSGEILSSELDAFKENRFSLSASGPISTDFGFFAIAEYTRLGDGSPSAIPLKLTNEGRELAAKPNNGSKSINIFSRFDASFGALNASLSFDGTYTDLNTFAIRANAKGSGLDYRYNYEHNSKSEIWDRGGRLKLDYFLTEKSFFTLSTSYRSNGNIQGDGVHYNRLNDYGLLSKNPNFLAAGVNLGATHPGETNYNFFAQNGRVNDFFNKFRQKTWNSTLDYSNQIGNHFIEAGISYREQKRRNWSINPVQLQITSNQNDIANGLKNNVYHQLVNNNVYGYDLYGNETNDYSFYETFNEDGSIDSRVRINPEIGENAIAFYLNDKLEWDDFILSVGLRFDGFKPTGVERFKNPQDLFGSDDELGLDDYEEIPWEYYVSPRIGFAFPVSDISSFHAAYGVLRQFADVNRYYSSWNGARTLERRFSFSLNTGHINASKTTTYELGLKHRFSETIGLEITGFYKNQQGLENLVAVNTEQKGQMGSIFSQRNQDFSINKGFSLSVKAINMGNFSSTLDYTYQKTEATGSNNTSSFVALFRDPQAFNALNFLMPVTFDRTNVLNLNIDYRWGADASSPFLRNLGVNFLFRYASGFTYTPLQSQDLIQGSTNFGNTIADLNSGRMPDIHRIDLKFDKKFNFSGLNLEAYLRVENLFDRDNIMDVYQSSGQADNTNFVKTTNGQEQLKDKDVAYFNDRADWELHPNNYGLPRRIYLGLRYNF